MQQLGETFLCETSTPKEISDAGERVFVILYNGKSKESLNDLRYHRYLNLVATSNRTVRPEMLPPTDRAAHFHSQSSSSDYEMEMSMGRRRTTSEYQLRMESGKITTDSDYDRQRTCSSGYPQNYSM